MLAELYIYLLLFKIKARGNKSKQAEISPCSFLDCPSCLTGAIVITDGHSRPQSLKTLWDHYEDGQTGTSSPDGPLLWIHVCSLKSQ